jgi:maltooligosyltrehalose trehalohydrolase
MGLDGVWADDFHHQMRVSLAGDRDGYYIDYEGTAPDIAATLEHGWFYTGQYSKLMEGPRGAPADDVPLPCFVQCIQNHDQVGNRAFGERLNHEAAPAAYRAASVLLLCSPSTPLLFMGQEWAASSPFLYFTDHNPELGRLVTEGRRSEFASFASFAGTEIPDPQARETFERSKLRWEERAQPEHQGMLALYRDVLALRARLPALQERARQYMRSTALDASTLVLWRTTPNTADTLLLLVYLGNEPVTIDLDEHGETIAPTGFRWSLLLDSEAENYSGSAGSSPFSGGDPATGQLKLTAPRAILLEVAPV